MPQGQYPAILAGEAFTASLVQSFAPLFAWKASDESVTSSVTLQNDNDLYLPVAANAVYRFDCYLDYEAAAGAATGITWGWTGPSGYTLRYHLLDVTTGSSPTPNVGSTKQGTDTPSAGGTGAAALMGVSMRGTLFTAAASGILQLQWAQASSSATATIVHGQSYLELARRA